MAFTHHVLIRLAAVRCGYTTFKDYIVLGDDVAIADAKVAAAYHDIIKSIGIDISLSKSVVPTEGYNSWEFASKLMINGVVHNPLPLGLLLEGDLQRILRLYRYILSVIKLLPVEGLFRRLLEGYGPTEVPSIGGPFIVGSYGLKSLKGLNFETFLTLLGIHHGLSL